MVRAVERRRRGAGRIIEPLIIPPPGRPVHLNLPGDDAAHRKVCELWRSAGAVDDRVILTPDIVRAVRVESFRPARKDRGGEFAERGAGHRREDRVLCAEVVSELELVGGSHPNGRDAPKKKDTGLGDAWSAVWTAERIGNLFGRVIELIGQGSRRPTLGRRSRDGDRAHDAPIDHRSIGRGCLAVEGHCPAALIVDAQRAVAARGFRCRGVIKPDVVHRPGGVLDCGSNVGGIPTLVIDLLGSVGRRRILFDEVGKFVLGTIRHPGRPKT